MSPGSELRKGLGDLPLVLGLVLVTGLATAPFAFQDSFYERDSYRMLLGVLDALRTGDPFASPLLYNRNASFGYYGFLFQLISVLGISSDAVPALMNRVNGVAVLLFPIPFYFVVRHCFGRGTAIAANLLLLSTPAWWSLSLYAHPMLPATLLFTVALWLQHHATVAQASAARGLPRAGACVLLLFAALATRVDVVLLFPLLVLSPMAAGERLRASVRRYGQAPVVALGLFLGALLWLPSRVDAAPPGLLVLLRDYHDPARILASLAPAAGHLLGAVGPLFLGVFLAYTVFVLTERRRREILMVLIPVWGIALFWLPNSAPPRHFVYLLPWLTVGVALALRTAMNWLHGSILEEDARLVPAAVGLAVVGVLASLGLGALGELLPTPPSLFSHRFIREHEQERASRLALDLDALAPQPVPVFVVADATPVVARLWLDTPELTVRVEQTELSDGDANLQYVRHPRNRFVLLEQGWRTSRVRELLERDGLAAGWSVLLDPYNPWIAEELPGPWDSLTLLPPTRKTPLNPAPGEADPGGGSVSRGKAYPGEPPRG